MGQGVTIDITAQVHGLQEAVAKYKAALEKIDVGTTYGRQFERAYKDVEKHVNRLASKPQQRATSELGISKIYDDVGNAVSKVQELDGLLQQLQAPDIRLESLSQGAQDANAEIQKLKESLQNTKQSGFADMINDSKVLSDTFKELGVNIKNLTPESGKEILKDQFGKSVENAKQLRQELADLKNEQKSFEEKSALTSTENQTIRKRYSRTTGSITGLKKIQDEIGTLDKVKLDSTIEGWIQKAGQIESVKPKIAEVRQELEKFKENLKLETLDTDFLNLRKKLGETVGSEARNVILGSGSQKNVNALRDQITATYDENRTARAQRIIDKFSEKVFAGVSDDNPLKKQFDEILNVENMSDRVNAIIQLFGNLKQAIEEIEEADRKQAEENTAKIAEKQQQYSTARENAREGQQANTAYNDVVKGYETRITTLEEEIKRLNAIINGEKGSAANKLKSGTGLSDMPQQILNENTAAAAKYNEQLKNVEKSERLIGKIEGITQRWFSIYAAVRMVGQAVRSVISTVKELDKTITEIAIVTNMTQEDLWGQMQSYTDMARQYAASISGVYKVSQLYYQQGKLMV